MKTLVDMLANRWYAVRTQVANLLPARVVDLYARVHERLDHVTAPSIGTPAMDWCLASFLIIAGPLLVASLLLAAFCGGGLWNCAPVWNDEVWYFNEMAVFESSGWTGGYTVCQEQPARAAWTRFGTHGPFGPAIYGAFARVTGSHVATIPMLHAILLVVGSAFWVVCCRLSLRQSWAAALVAATFWPLILYIPTSMQEGLHLSIAFVLAALLVLLIRHRDNNWLLVLTLVAIAAAAQTRVTWSWIAVPAMWIAMRPQNVRQVALLAAGCVPFVGALYLEAVMLVSPYPNFMSEVLHGAVDSPVTTMGMVLKHALKGLERYVAPNRDTLVQVAFRYQTLIVAGVAVFQLWQYYSRRDRSSDAAAPNSERFAVESMAYAAVFLNLLCILGFVVAFYDVKDWRDYRVVAPHLLLAVLVLLGCNALHWLKNYALVGLVASVLVAVQFAEFHRPRVAFNAARVAPFGEQVSKVVTFEPGADAWENTMLMETDSMSSQELLALPHGIGISSVISWEQQAWPPRSKYVLLTRDRAADLGIPASMCKVAETRIGDIYIRR